jgi:16S rRNA C967 or C1407 C5-methylase (RsmB/RsmF family)/NOL1/NOP2/fmu family ribosome biogenesis protein
VLEIDWHQVLGPLLNSPGGLDSGELHALNDAISKHSPRAVRLKPQLSVDELPFETEPIPWLERGRRLTDSSCRPGAYVDYAAGDYYIQDAGSMLALRLANVQAGEWVCDACAAPGGKATGLLEQLAGTGLLLANEVIRSRLETLEFALARVGTPNYLVTNLELESLADLTADAFDCIVVDAPCTGQSMVGRGKQSLAAFTARQIEHSAARQQRILRSAAELVQPGGRLVYSTCTFAFAENEQIIEWFRSAFPSWIPIVVPELAPWHSATHEGCYRLWPHRDHCDGAFAAALLRPADDGSFARSINATPQQFSRPLRSGKSSYGRGNFAPRELDVAELPWLQFPPTLSSVSLWEHRDEVHFFADLIPQEWLARAQSGIPIAQDRGRFWQPCYASSVVNLGEFQTQHSVELNKAQAADFLDGASLRFSEQELPSNDTGWTVVHYRNRPLGWGKAANGVLKNHLPKSLRKPRSSIIVE